MAVIPAEFPAYEKLFVLDPDAHSIIVERTVLRKALQGALERDVLRMSITTDRLRLDNEPPQDLEVSYSGPDLTVGLNPKFAHYAVVSSVGPEVMIDLTKPTGPVVFRSATDSSFICMVMPIKLLNAA